MKFFLGGSVSSSTRGGVGERWTRAPGTLAFAHQQHPRSAVLRSSETRRLNYCEPGVCKERSRSRSSACPLGSTGPVRTIEGARGRIEGPERRRRAPMADSDLRPPPPGRVGAAVHLDFCHETDNQYILSALK